MGPSKPDIRLIEATYTEPTPDCPKRRMQNYTITEVLNGFLVYNGNPYADAGHSDSYVAKDMAEVAQILKRLDEGKTVTR